MLKPVADKNAIVSGMKEEAKNTGVPRRICARQIAATISVVRSVRGQAYGDLVPINARTNIGALERGKSNITVDKLGELSRPM